MTAEPLNILMTGGGAPGAAGIIRCLREEKQFNIFVADARPDVVGKYLGDHFEVIPQATSPVFIDYLLSYCKKNNIRIVLPLVTKELIPLATRIRDFEALGINVMVSPVSSLEIAINKGKLYEFLQWRGIEVPAFRIVETIAQFKEAVTELGYPLKELCFKPCESNGSRGFRILKEDIDGLDLLFNQKPDSTCITLDNAVSILSKGSFPPLLLADYLPGEEYSVDCLAVHGEPGLVVPRLRKRMINGISVEGEIIEEKEAISYCSRIIKELRLHGNIGIQLKRSAAGRLLILEINPRVQGTIAAILGAGVNLPLLAVKQGLGWPLAEDELKVRWGTKFIRHWAELFY